MNPARAHHIFGLVHMITVRTMDNFEPARAYLRERGLTNETIRQLGFGYWHVPTMAHTLSRMSDPPLEWELERLGLTDSLSGRITLPLRDPVSRTIGFIGRTLGVGGVAQPKYLYPAASQHSRRSHLLGLDVILRWSKILPPDPLLVVEGPLDAYLLLQARHYAVCTHGSSFTAEQALLISALKPVKTIFLADGDPYRSDSVTGGENMRKSYEKHRNALPRDVFYAECPEGSDPASLAQSDPETLLHVIKSAERLGY